MTNEEEVKKSLGQVNQSEDELIQPAPAKKVMRGPPGRFGKPSFGQAPEKKVA